MLAATLMSYIRFFVLLSPIIIPTMAIFGSLFNANFKGFVYVLGLTIAMLFGSLIAPTVGVRVPGTMVDGRWKPGIDAACNLIGTSLTGWGTQYAAPGAHALLLAFTTTYLFFPMFLNGTTNMVLVGSMIFLLILSAAIRISSPMNCLGLGAVVAGWGTGFIFGAIWYFAVISLVGTQSNLTYFEVGKSDRQQCTLDKKSFRCRRKMAAN